MKWVLYYLAVLSTLQFAWNLYQDIPSVTGFYDHTVACSAVSEKNQE